MPQSLSALIVDDVAAVRSYISQILQQLGITSVIEAADGNTATQLFSQHQPQLVFLDIQLPDIDGQQLLKLFKQQDQHTVVFMVSAFSSVENLKQAIENGAKAFVIKPFTASRINSLVRPLLH
ncbi:response regulator transcription factor [Rheinheimera sp.]|uniref:response regulator transcription factor n=1 Tax=Rheinheimera sp. TaxID=1869214 RepID=UPI0027345333|nr:response regulator [Rheinheimera sp.]MDP2716356.1 response regulator [Rheinheimera sp.]